MLRYQKIIVPIFVIAVAATSLSAHAQNCMQVAIGDPVTGNLRQVEACMDASGNWIDPPWEDAEAALARSTAAPQWNQPPQESAIAPFVNSETAFAYSPPQDAICNQETARVNNENVTLPKVVGTHVELRPLRIDCARKIVTGDIRLLLNSNEISSNGNLKNTLVTAQRDAACSESFVSQHGWTAETNYYDENFAYVDRVSTRQQDCSTVMAVERVPVQSSTPQNMQELSDVMDGALKGAVGGILGGMISGIFGGSGGGGSTESCPQRRDCSEGRCITVRDC